MADPDDLAEGAGEPSGEPAGRVAAAPVKGSRRRPGPFVPKPVEAYADPDLNPYLKLHRTFGPEVIPAEQGPPFRGRWQDAFDRVAPLHVEIGPGNGFFLTGMATRHPERNWLGIEIRFKRVVLTAKKLRRAGVTWARVLRFDAHHLDQLFAPGEIAQLYVNHPDPWTKTRREKHRLLQRPFAEWICQAVAAGGEIRMKSDYHPNLDDFADMLDGLPLTVQDRVDDIARDGLPWGDDDIRTNYQRKFDEKGLPVAAVRLRRGA